MNSTQMIGPVFPIPIPFLEDQSVDYHSLVSYCDFLVNNGAKNLLVTVGTSRFNLLNRQEMLEVNKVVASVGNQDTTIVVSGPGPSSGSKIENIAFAEEAALCGADGLIVVFPERFYTKSQVSDFFLSIADSSPIPIWIHAVPFRDGFGGVNSSRKFDLDLLNTVVDHPNIVGIKEENGDRDLYLKVQSALKNKICIIGAGGAMRRYLKDHPLGAHCYLVGIESFAPRLGLNFFQLMSEHRFDEAELMALKHEDSFFNLAVQYGWHRSLKAALNISGLMPLYERSPFPPLSDGEVHNLSSIMTSTGLV